jgi:hypothetical protein
MRIVETYDLFIFASLLLTLLICGCEIPFSMPVSVNLHRTAPPLDKRIKIGGQIGTHLNLAGGIAPSRGAIEKREVERDNFRKIGAEFFLLCRIDENVDIGFAFGESEEYSEDSKRFCITWGGCDRTESSRISRGYRVSSQIILLHPFSWASLSAVPEIAYYTTGYTLKNFTAQEINESGGRGIWVRLPLLIGFQSLRSLPIGASLTVGGDIIYARYEISTRLIDFFEEEIASEDQVFSEVIPGIHAITAVRIYSFEIFWEGWVFLPSQSVLGMSFGLSLAF